MSPSAERNNMTTTCRSLNRFALKARPMKSDELNNDSRKATVVYSVQLSTSLRTRADPQKMKVCWRMPDDRSVSALVQFAGTMCMIGRRNTKAWAKAWYTCLLPQVLPHSKRVRLADALYHSFHQCILTRDAAKDIMQL